MRLDEPVASSPSLLSFLLPSTEAGTGGGRLGGGRTGTGASSSESLRVRSITTGPENDGGGGGACTKGLELGACGIRGGDSSRLTSFSSSESDESAIVIVLEPLGADDTGGGEAGSAFDGTLEGAATTPFFFIHSSEPAVAS